MFFTDSKGDLWQHLTNFLNATSVTRPAPPNSIYSNSNYAILQAVVMCYNLQKGQVIPRDYVAYVNENILSTVGIDTRIFNTLPDDKSWAALSYVNSSDTACGYHWDTVPNIGCGGWISDVFLVMKFLVGLRDPNGVLDASTVDAMLSGGTGKTGQNLPDNNQLGWYSRSGTMDPSVTYYHHNGSLNIVSGQGTRTAIVRSSNGYDCVLLMNSYLSESFDIIAAIINVLEQAPPPPPAAP